MVQMSENETVEILRKIEQHLSMLSAPIRREALAAFSDEVLRTDARRRMFALMDGSRNIPEIASETGTSGQAVRDLVKLLEAKGFVSVRAAGASQVPTYSQEAIVDWHYNRG